jgi:asparagine synthase (glutamine-hydrolysing)
MCGIAGFIAAVGHEHARSIAVNMAQTLRHRGPDRQDAEVLTLSNGRVLGLAHALLSIIGKPGEGTQPFHVDGGILLFNGAIYNFRELRSDLQRAGTIFRTSTDTEVLAQGLAQKGINFLQKTRGMYAFAFWDVKQRTLLLGRDPFGVKPLYYARTPRGLIFGSEYKAILPYLSRTNIDTGAVTDYLRFRYVPGEATLVKEIRKVKPGSVLVWKESDDSLTGTDYYLLPTAETAPSSTEVFERLRTAVERRSVADVEVAALLSGGIDSGVVCDLLSRSVKALHTYTLDVGDPKLDESSAAKKISESIGVVNVRISSDELSFADLSSLAYHMDDPYGDPIILALHRIFSSISGKQRVVVTGEGSDEIFSGYVHHRAMGLMDRIPSSLRSSSLRALHLVPAAVMRAILPYAEKMSREDYEHALKTVSSWRTRKLSSFLSTFFLFDQRSLRHPDRSHAFPEIENAMSLESLRQWDLRNWLPDSQLFKLDKISMASSIEAREPFVDIDLIESINAVPSANHVSLWHDKPVLRKAVAGRLRLGNDVVNRRKTSFYQPFRGAHSNRISGQIQDCVLSNAAFLSDYLTDQAIRDTYSGNGYGLLGQKRRFSLGALALWNERVWSQRSSGVALD